MGVVVTEAYIAQAKLDKAKELFDNALSKGFNTVDEFIALFPTFDSDIRAETVRLANKSDNPVAKKIMNVANIVFYIATVPTDYQQAAIWSTLSKVFPDLSKDEKFECIKKLLLAYIKLTPSSKQKAIRGLTTLLGPLGETFSRDYDKYNLQYCDRFMDIYEDLEQGKRVDVDDPDYKAKGKSEWSDEYFLWSDKYALMSLIWLIHNEMFDGMFDTLNENFEVGTQEGQIISGIAAKMGLITGLFKVYLNNR